MQGYESARPRAQLVDVLLAAQIALYSLRCIGALYIALMPDDELGVMLTRGACMSQPFLLLLFIATAVALIAWLHRAARNLPSLRMAVVGSWTLTPKDVVAAFFAPFVNLFAIPYVVRHVWLASDPTPPEPTRRRSLVAGWWVALLVAAFAPLPAALVAALMLTSAACLIAIVRDTQRRQDEQLLDEELRRAVPRPAADALR
jgi:hypothetical protein